MLNVFLSFLFYCYCHSQVVYEPPPQVGASGLFAGLPSRGSGSIFLGAGWRSVLKSIVRGVVSDVKEEIVSELTSTMADMNSVEKRYMAKDDTADRIKM